jgi:hypothetical protein
MDEEEAKPAVALSQAFDSAAATMRLAALTGTSKDMDELAKTLKIERPSAEAISQAAPATKAPRSAARQDPAEPPIRSGGSNLMLIAVVILVLLGIVAILVA